MSKGTIKACVLAGIFVVAVIVFGIVTNRTNKDMTTELSEATLPTISLYYQEEEINELYGYTTEMNPIYMRDDITPVDTDRLLPIMIHTKDYSIDAISYEIRSMDMNRLISNTQLDKYTQQDGTITANLTIQNLLDANQEYLLILSVESGDSTLYYYTRIIEPSACYVKECIDFAKDFHAKTFDDTASNALALYMEPDASVDDNTSLAKVSINSSLKQVTWADFNGTPLGEPAVSIKEINESYNVIILEYVLSATGDAGELEYYNVKEYFRVRYANDRMYLLNFERTTDQIFRSEETNFYNNYIQLGIGDSKVDYKANETGTIVCFVREGELWSYNSNEKKLSQVFSFRGYEGIDERENHAEHDIRIIKVDETGSTDFVVYGYMNRGVHEGQVGICVYHNDSVANTVEEELFIPSTHSYEVLKAELGQLMYENESGMFYIMLNGTLYEINMETMEQKVLVSGFAADSYAISESNQYIAYIDGGDSNQGKVVHVLNLEDKDQYDVEASNDNFIRPLGFIQNDFIYGEAAMADVYTDQAGNTQFPMGSIYIAETESEDHGILKDYHKDGYYISSIRVEDYTIYVNREKYNGMTYIEAEQDTIMNREGDILETVSIHTTATDRKKTQIQLALNDVEEVAAKKLLTPKQILLEENREIALEEPEPENFYYAYARGEVVAATDSATEAIKAANDNLGVVVGSAQQYIWKRAKKTTQNTLPVTVGSSDAGGSSIAQAVSAMLEMENINVAAGTLLESGNTPKQILKDTMQDTTVLDLTGCDLEEVLYYVNLSTPVFAMNSGSSAVLIVGYDTTTVSIFDPAAGTTSKMSMSDARELFLQAGNIFFAYIK